MLPYIQYNLKMLFAYIRIYKGGQGSKGFVVGKNELMVIKYKQRHKYKAHRVGPRNSSSATFVAVSARCYGDWAAAAAFLAELQLLYTRQNVIRFMERISPNAAERRATCCSSGPYLVAIHAVAAAILCWIYR